MGVLDRRAILTLSVAISVVAHGVFLVASPSLVLMGRGRPEGLLPETVRVRLLDKAELQQYESAPGAAGSGLATRPGSITDLIQNEMEKNPP